MEIENLATQLARKGISVLFVWVPAHCGITGNELADQAAKQASHLGLITQTPITGPEFLSSISSKILEEEEAWLRSFHTELLDSIITSSRQKKCTSHLASFQIVSFVLDVAMQGLNQHSSIGK